MALVSRFKGALQARNGGLSASAASCKAPGCDSGYIQAQLGRLGAANHISLPHPAKSLRNHPAPGRPKWGRDGAIECSLAPEERGSLGPR